MDRTIAVTGTGSLRVKPDQAERAMELEAKDKDYQRSVALSSEQLEEVTRALTAVGFAKEELKTSAFQVRADYRGEHDDKGN